MTEPDSLKCQCGEPILAGPRFRSGGPTALLCWVCARLHHSVAIEDAGWNSRTEFAA